LGERGEEERGEGREKRERSIAQVEYVILPYQ